MPDAPNRSQRQACWDARDAYFGCLDANHILVPGDETGSLCKKEAGAYKKDCIASWVEYFSKSRVGRAQSDFTMKGGDGRGGFESSGGTGSRPPPPMPAGRSAAPPPSAPPPPRRDAGQRLV